MAHKLKFEFAVIFSSILFSFHFIAFSQFSYFQSFITYVFANCNATKNVDESKTLGNNGNQHTPV